MALKDRTRSATDNLKRASDVRRARRVVATRNRNTESIKWHEVRKGSNTRKPKLENGFVHLNCGDIQYGVSNRTCIRKPKLAYTISENQTLFDGVIVVPDSKYIMNLNRLQEFATLTENWDGYGAKEINKTALSETIEVLKNIKIQPEVYPTPNGYIQMEFYLPNEKYLEIKLTDKDIVFYYDDTVKDELCHFEYADKESLYAKIKEL